MVLDVGGILRITAAVALLMIVGGMSFAGTWDFNPDMTPVKHKHESQSEFRGEGYVMVYQKVNTNNLSLDEYMHGSGSFKVADLINSEQKTTGTMDYYYVLDQKVWNSKDGNWVRKQSGSASIITFTKQNDAVQSPTSFAFGTGWYANNPVKYNSLLKDKTVARSYQEATMMHHQLEYARAFKGDISVDMNCTGPKANADGRGLTQMRIEDDVTEGTVDVGELQTDTLLTSAGRLKDMKKQGWKKPIIEMDEYYVGTFTLQKNMKIDVTKSRSTSNLDWLPCCSGGYLDYFNYNDYTSSYTEKGLTAGIFDCNCRNTSISSFLPKWNTTKAQFPNDQYRLKP